MSRKNLINVSTEEESTVSAFLADSAAFDVTSTPLYSQFIHLSRYSRWLDEKGRRETWKETVERYITFFSAKHPALAEEISKLFQPIYALEVMPSMRCLMAAGPALDRDNVAGYNCSYAVVNNIKTFDEIMYVLMCGTGVGFSVERQYVSQLPDIAETFHDSDTTIVVADSKIGWATSLRQLITLLYSGSVPKWDMSKVRLAGARLKTFGGRASGPEPLEKLFRFCVTMFKKAAGRKLSSLECHDLVCMIADIVVVGGVRRSALISLSNLSDDRMRLAKSGQWWENNKQRQLANNSACYTEKPEFEVFLQELSSLYASKSGERGVFSRVASQKQAAKNGRRDANHEFGTNPCSEIILRPNQFCNLSEVIVRSNDTLETLKLKVISATILGTLQSTLTSFRYLRKMWETNTAEESLLGVSMTGIMDHPIMGNPDAPELKAWLSELRELSVSTNKEWAAKLGVNPSTAITCVKPSGCRPGDALTATSNGLLTLDELLENHGNDVWGDVPGDVQALQGTSNSKITKTFNNGEQPVLELTLSYGMTVESTTNHKWFVKQRCDQDVNEWVTAADIQPGDVLDVCITSYTKETEAELVQVTSNVAQRQPLHMSPDLAWLLGYFYGSMFPSLDGSTICSGDTNTLLLEKAQRVFKELFDADLVIAPKIEAKDIVLPSLKADLPSLETMEKIECNSSYVKDPYILENGNGFLPEWLYAANLFDKRDPFIPRMVRESSRESVIAFLAGYLDSCGYVSTKGDSSKFTLNSPYDDFAKNLQDVAWAVGLGIGRAHSGKSVQHNRDMWVLTSTAVQDDESVQLLKKHSIKASKVTTWHHETATKPTSPGKVVSSRVSRVVPTYDVEVEGTHWYYAGSVKSHNTVSQLVDSASGIHPRFSKYYIRRVRADQRDPLARMMRDSGLFPCVPDVMKPEDVFVFSFPMKSPDTATVVSDVGAMHQLKLWASYQEHWCEHKPSITVYYKDSEFLEVGNWLWNNFDTVSGISFLPYSDHIYAQAPYESITKEQYEELASKMPTTFDWSQLKEFELEDSTTGTQTLACAGGFCEVVDLTATDTTLSSK